MRIAYAFYDRSGYTAGPRINALRVLPELVRRGHDVTALIQYWGECPAEEILQNQGVSVSRTPYLPYVQDQVEWYLSTLQSIDPDVFVPNISIGGCYAGRFVRESGRPTVAGHLSDDPPNWALARTFCGGGDRWAVSGLFCMGKELGDVVRGWKPKRTRVVDIPHGVPVSGLVADPSGPLRLLYAGRLEIRQKQVMEVAGAMCQVLRRYPDATAKMLGDGSQAESVRELVAEKGVESRFEISGFVAPDRVQEEMVGSNVLVLLSDYEGVPGAVMDAMACGLVPVCLDIPGGLRELVIDRETGILVNDRDSEFHEAIDRLARHPIERERLAANARSHITKAFSLTVAVDRWESLFRRLTSEAPRRRVIRAPRRLRLPAPCAEFGHEDLRKPVPSITSRIGARWRRLVPGG